MEDPILIINHDDQERKMYEHWFTTNGFQTFAIHSSVMALKLLNSMTPKLIMIDMDLPVINGLDFLREMRINQLNWTPIIITSSKDEELDAVLGLELGADEYLIKPLKGKETIAKAKAIMRRGNLCCGNEQTEIQQMDGDSFFINGDLYLDHEHFTLFVKGNPVELTRKEYELLYYLLKNKGKVLTRRDLVNEMVTEEASFDERIIDVFISRLRNKIEPSRRNPIYIKTLRNMGYMMMDVTTSNRNEKNSLLRGSATW